MPSYPAAPLEPYPAQELPKLFYIELEEPYCAMLGCRKSWTLIGMQEVGIKAASHMVSSEICFGRVQGYQTCLWIRIILACTKNDLKPLWSPLGLPAKLEAKHLQFHSLATSIAGVLWTKAWEHQPPSQRFSTEIAWTLSSRPWLL